MRSELQQILAQHNFNPKRFLEDNHQIPQELMEELKHFYASDLGSIPPATPEKRFNTDCDKREEHHNQAIQDRLRQDLSR